ncbi:MAG TPA: hypothetical protein VN736_02470 [Candidatus Limnocylindrales bacterium]|nr:hypothetical protein [Candidatus Limnocylindrales bacterium]
MPTPDEIKTSLAARAEADRRLTFLRSTSLDDQWGLLNHAFEVLPDGHALKQRIASFWARLAEAASIGTIDDQEKLFLGEEFTLIALEARKSIH